MDSEDGLGSTFLFIWRKRPNYHDASVVLAPELNPALEREIIELAGDFDVAHCNCIYE